MDMELEEGEYVEEEEMEQRRFTKTKTAIMDKRRGREEDDYDTVSMELDSEPETAKTNGAMLEELEDDADLLRRQLLSQVRKKKAKKPAAITTSKSTSTSEITKTTTLTPKMSKVTTSAISNATSSSTSSEKATMPLVSSVSSPNQTPKNGKTHLQAENPANGLPQMKEKLSQLHEQLTVAQLKQSTIVRKKRRLQDSLVQCETDLMQSQSEINSIVEAILALWADASDLELKPALMESKKEPTTKATKSPKVKEGLAYFTTPTKKVRLEENKDSTLKTPISHQTPSKSERPVENKKREEEKRGTGVRKEDKREEKRKRDREREGGKDDEKQRKETDERQKSEKDKQRKEGEHPKKKEECETTKLEKKQKTDTMKKTAETDELQKEQQNPSTSKAKTAEETTIAGERAEQPPPQPPSPSPTKTPESTPEKSPNVDSFLASIRAYRLNPHFPHSMLTHLAVSNKLDPYVPLCPFQLDGICADKNCPWQHENEYRLTDVELVAEVIGLWPKLCPVGIQPKAYAARLLATDSLDTVIGFLLSTMPEEAHRIKLDIVKGIPRLCKPIPPDEKIDFVPFLISSTNHHRQQRSETVSPPLIL